MRERDDALRAACPATCPPIPGADEIGLTHRFVEANGARLHVVEAGVEAGAGPSVLLLHGFPEFWYGWRDQIGPLARQFRVIVPDLRGYNLSSKPADGYDVATLAGDAAALIRACGGGRAHVVGHDWGGIVAWATAMLHPEAVDRLAVFNAPHPAAYLREIRRNLRQALRSWYIGLFQVPRLPEWLLTARGGLGVAELMRSAAVDPTRFTASELAPYRRAMLRPGAARATLAYYRALARTRPSDLGRWTRVITSPTLLGWGLRDVALVPELTEGLDEWIPNLRVERVPDAGHWIQHERPELVSRLLLDHLAD